MATDEKDLKTGDATNSQLTPKQTPAPTKKASEQSSARTGTVTLEDLQKELGDERGREEYLKYGAHFGVTTLNIANYHPPLDLDSIKE